MCSVEAIRFSIVCVCGGVHEARRPSVEAGSLLKLMEKPRRRQCDAAIFSELRQECL